MSNQHNAHIKCCEDNLEFKLIQPKPWDDYKLYEATCKNCKTTYILKQGNSFAYKKNADGEWECARHKILVLAETVAHPVWDGPFPMSGSGKCEYEEIPYCPECEEKLLDVGCGVGTGTNNFRKKLF